jgi:hypothetical protein
MGPFSDCYVLAENRTARQALDFLSEFTPNALPSWDPSDPTDVIGAPPNISVQQLLEYLADHPTLDYRMYFHNQSEGSPYHSILTYCADGSLILGLSGDEQEESAIMLLRRLELFSQSKGYWTVEEAPVSSRAEFAIRLTAGR